jgi:hypothetical protein
MKQLTTEYIDAQPVAGNRLPVYSHSSLKGGKGEW